MLPLSLLPLALLICVDYVLSAKSITSQDSRGLLERLPNPPSTLPSLSRRDAGTNSRAAVTQLTLSSDGSSYYTVLTAGNISFRLSIDTGSSDLWLVSSACSSNVCKSTPSFPLSYHSPSFGVINNNETAFSLSFADGSSSSGFIATETVSLDNFSVPGQVIGLVNTTNVPLENEISGILGMGFPRLSVLSSLLANSTPFVNGLAQRGQLDYPFFGLSLTRDNAGTLTLGAIDIDVVKNVSSIEWHKVMPFSPFGAESNTSSYFQWVVRLPQVGVNGTNFDTEPTYPNITTTSLALFDVGTNGIFGPYQDVSRIFQNLEESRLIDANLGQWALPCDTDEVLTFNFGFGQGNFTLQPTDYLIGPVSGNPTFCLSWPRAVQSSGDGIDWQLGTPFLRTVYSVFSYGIDNKEPPTIGLYPISNVTTFTENATYISSFFASASATIATTLPNSLLSTPSATTPTYVFNTSVPASVGVLAPSALGTGTYSALLAGASVNASALPTATAAPTLVTLLVTEASGEVITSTSHAPTTSVALGRPPGESAARATMYMPTARLLFGTALVLGAAQYLLC
ncbi:acid protease [Phellopilus nigrolimitatus]|nr:acid protease [Phellopilus nigrolimitatus]